jgi:hypothetical protein
VGDPEKPRPQRDLVLARAQVGVSPHKDVLEGVLGILPSGKHLPRVGEQPLVVALVNYREGVFTTGSEERQELVIGPEP